LTAGVVLQSSNPALARLVLSRGLERLSVADFRREYLLLLDPHCPLGQCARRLVTVLRKADYRDVQALAALLPEKSATAFCRWAREARRNSKQPPEQAMPALLDAFWQNGLCDSIGATLETERCCSDATIKQRTPDQTIADATQAIAFDGSAFEMYKLRASAYVAKQEYGKVIADCAAVLRLRPNDVWAHSTRGAAHLQENHLDEAIADLTEVIRLDPKSVDAYYCRSAAYGARGDAFRANADTAVAKKLEAARK
jgi:tetratricopeptide (TPR) repeat protein